MLMFMIGKTHTMLGTDDQPGLIQIAVRDLFRIVSERADRDYTLRVSCVEVYNEKIQDLLAAGNEVKQVTIREDSKKRIETCDAAEELIDSAESAITLLKRGTST
jgi:centromeric protein E